MLLFGCCWLCCLFERCSFDCSFCYFALIACGLWLVALLDYFGVVLLLWCFWGGDVEML